MDKVKLDVQGNEARIVEGEDTLVGKLLKAAGTVKIKGRRIRNKEVKVV